MKKESCCAIRSACSEFAVLEMKAYRSGEMLRTIAIWVFGLLASAIVGMLIGAVLLEQGAGLGLIAGLALFAIVRLLLTMPR